MAKRSYPTSEVRGSGQEHQAATAQEWPRGATLRLRSGAAAERSYPTAERSYPTTEVRGGGRECQAATAQEQLRGATPRLRSGVAAGRSNLTSKEWWLRGWQEGLKELFHIQGRRGGGEEIPLIQGKEQ